MNKDEKITLAWCDTGNVHGGLFLSFLLNKPENITNFLRSTGKRISTQRQEIFDAWMAEEFDDSDWILWIDSDIIPSENDIRLLLETADKNKYPVLSALCFTAIGKNIIPCSFYNNKNGGISSISYEDVFSKSIIKVDSIGFGMVLMHRSVYKELISVFGYTHLFAEIDDPSNHSIYVGEDIAFCKYLNELSVPIHVHTGVIPKHIKSLEIDEDIYRLYNQ